MKSHLKKFFTAITALSLCAFSFSSCNSSSDGPGNYQQTLLDFMTYESTTGSYSTFSYQRSYNAPVVKIIANHPFTDAQIPFGSRMVVMFNAPGDTLPAKNETIDLLAAGQAFTAKPELVDMSENHSWDQNPINLQLLKLLNNYIDLIVNVNTGDLSKQEFKLYVDRASMETDCAQVYISTPNESDYSYGATQFYISFDINEIKKPNITKLCIHLNNTATPQYSILTYDLTNGTLIQ